MPILFWIKKPILEAVAYFADVWENPEKLEVVHLDTGRM